MHAEHKHALPTRTRAVPRTAEHGELLATMQVSLIASIVRGFLLDCGETAAPKQTRKHYWTSTSAENGSLLPIAAQSFFSTACE